MKRENNPVRKKSRRRISAGKKNTKGDAAGVWKKEK